MTAMRRRCHQQRARPRETVPHHRAGAREHLIGHEEGELRARGGRTDVFAPFQVIIAVNRALSGGDEAAEVDLLDLWSEGREGERPSPMWPQSKESTRSRSGCFIWMGPGRLILSKTDWMYFFWSVEEMLLPNESTSSFQEV